MNSKIKQGETVLVLGIAAALMALGIGGLSAFLAQGETANAGTAYAEAINTDSIAPSAEVTAPDSLNVKVDMRGNELPEGAVSAQYAVAVAADVAEHTFGAHATDRAFVTFLDTATHFTNHDLSEYAWNIMMQTDQGILIVNVDATTGIDADASISSYEPNDESNWVWFDEWTEDIGDQQRLADEQRMQDAENDPNKLASPEPMTDEERAAVLDKKREGALEYAATMTEYPQGQKAVDYVNAQGVGNGASAVSGRILMEGSSLGADIYMVEVAMDDGSYLFVSMAQEANPDTSDYAFLGYRRSTIDLMTYSYGH